MCPGISPVLIEPRRFQILLFYRAFPGKTGVRFCEKALWRRSKGEAVAGDGIKSNETLVEAGLADLSRENTPGLLPLLSHS
jgi:hypothetical protein